MSDDDRASRLRERRHRAKQKAAGEPSESDEPDETAEPSDSSESSGTSKPSKPSVKDERVGTYMYLPPSLKKDVNRYYKRAAGEYEFEVGEELEKNRHWYPLVVEFGLDELRDADVEQIETLLDDAGLR